MKCFTIKDECNLIPEQDSGWLWVCVLVRYLFLDFISLMHAFHCPQEPQGSHWGITCREDFSISSDIEVESFNFWSCHFERNNSVLLNGCNSWILLYLMKLLPEEIFRIGRGDSSKEFLLISLLLLLLLQYQMIFSKKPMRENVI